MGADRTRRGPRDEAAIEHYREVLTAARNAGVKPWVCLHHFTLPGWFTEFGEGGFVDERARSYFWPRHVAFCAETFGDLVYGWKPINEPAAYSLDLPPRRSLARRARSGKSSTRSATVAGAARAWRERAGAGNRSDDPQLVAGLPVGSDRADDERRRAGRRHLARVDARRPRRRSPAPRPHAREIPELQEACRGVGAGTLGDVRAAGAPPGRTPSTSWNSSAAPRRVRCSPTSPCSGWCGRSRPCASPSASTFTLASKNLWSAVKGEKINSVEMVKKMVQLYADEELNRPIATAEEARTILKVGVSGTTRSRRPCSTSACPPNPEEGERGFLTYDTDGRLPAPTELPGNPRLVL